MYGVKGWLLLFAILILLGLGRDFSTLSFQAYKAGMSIYQFLWIPSPTMTWARSALLIDLVQVALIWWSLLTRHQHFRNFATAAVLCGFPLVAVSAVALSVDNIGESLAKSFVLWLFWSAVWVTYLQRSKRVRVTFEHCVVATGTAHSEYRIEPVGALTIPSVPRVGASAATFPGIAGPESRQPITASPLCRSAEQSPPATDFPEEELWAKALHEFEGSARRPGLWAKLFAEFGGNEAAAKAAYLGARVQELRASYHEGVERPPITTSSLLRRAVNSSSSGGSDEVSRQSSSDPIADEIRKVAPVLFPGGHGQILAAGRTMAGLLDYRIQPGEASAIFASTKYLAHTAKDKSKQRIVAYLVSKGLGKISEEEASEIYDRLIVEQHRANSQPVAYEEGDDRIFIDARLGGKDYVLQNARRSMTLNAAIFTTLLMGPRSTGWRGADELFEPSGNVMKALCGRYAIAQRDAIELAELLHHPFSSADLSSDHKGIFSDFIAFAREGAFYVVAP